MKALKFMGWFLARCVLHHLNQPEGESQEIGSLKQMVISNAQLDYFDGKIDKMQYDNIVRHVKESN